MSNDTAEHYHVFAVQDWGGSQEWIKGWDDQLTIKEARQFLADMIRADNARTPDEVAALIAEFGEDRFYDLVSTNVNPGWEAMWITGCQHTCRFAEQFDLVPNGLGDPTWTPGHIEIEFLDAMTERQRQAGPMMTH